MTGSPLEGSGNLVSEIFCGGFAMRHAGLLKAVAAGLAAVFFFAFSADAAQPAKGQKGRISFAQRKRVILKRHQLRVRILEQRLKILQEAVGCIKAAKNRDELRRCILAERKQLKRLRGRARARAAKRAQKGAKKGGAKGREK